MANLPINEEQIMQLQANGKVSPVTADMMKKKSAPVAEESIFPDFMMSQEYLDKRDAAQREPAAVEAVAVDPVKDTVDVAELAVAPKPVAVAPQEDVMKPISGAYGMQQKGLAGIADAQSKAATEQESALKLAQQEAADYDKQIKAVDSERKLKMEEYMKEMNSMHEQAAKMEKVNPNKYWQDKSTGSKISSVVGLMLGAIGGGLSGQGGNVALNMLNKSIEQDIEAQKDAYQRFKGQMGDKQSMFSMLMNQTGDEKSSLLGAKASALQIADLKLKEIAARSNSQEVKARAQVESGKIMEELGKVNLVMKQQMQQKLASRQANMGQGVEDPSLLTEDQQKRVVKMPNGLYKPAVSDEGAKIVNKMAVDSENLSGIILKLKKLNSPTLPYTERAGLLEAAKKEYILNKKGIEELGAISGTDMDLVLGTLGNPGGLNTEKADKILDQALEVARNKKENTYSQYVPGYKPIKRK